MNKELELWQFIANRLRRGERVVLLVVAESSGSSPGRQGYKMAVGSDGELCGSIGGGAMEVNLVEQSRAALAGSGAEESKFRLPKLVEQVHRENVPDASGMICSGRQTVILKELNSSELRAVDILAEDLQNGNEPWLVISEVAFKTAPAETEAQNCPLPHFERHDNIFEYSDKLGPKNYLYIIGGGHCALALSELMSRLDFKTKVFDNRQGLSTIQKNEFADQVKIVEAYELIEHQIPDGNNSYVVVMTLGYASDKVVMRRLIDRGFKYFGVLGSKAKMATLMKELRAEGFPADKLERIHTPIGLPINSRTPEEIAVSIAAEIISIKNA